MIVQLKRGIVSWSDGTKKIPHGPSGYFSKTNWGDRIDRRDGKDVLIKKTSALAKMVAKLKDHQWTKILDAAAVQARHRKVDTSNILITIEDSSDFELEDGDEEPEGGGGDLEGGNDRLPVDGDADME